MSEARRYAPDIRRVSGRGIIRGSEKAIERDRRHVELVDYLLVRSGGTFFHYNYYFPKDVILVILF